MSPSETCGLRLNVAAWHLDSLAGACIQNVSFPYAADRRVAARDPDRDPARRRVAVPLDVGRRFHQPPRRQTDRGGARTGLQLRRTGRGEHEPVVGGCVDRCRHVVAVAARMDCRAARHRDDSGGHRPVDVRRGAAVAGAAGAFARHSDRDLRARRVRSDVEVRVERLGDRTLHAVVRRVVRVAGAVGCWFASAAVVVDRGGSWPRSVGPARRHIVDVHLPGCCCRRRVGSMGVTRAVRAGRARGARDLPGVSDGVLRRDLSEYCVREGSITVVVVERVCVSQRRGPAVLVVAPAARVDRRRLRARCACVPTTAGTTATGDRGRVDHRWRAALVVCREGRRRLHARAAGVARSDRADRTRCRHGRDTLPRRNS